MTKKGMLIVLSGPSGVGKDSLVDALLRHDSGHSCVLSVSATTRAPRPGDVDGRDYHFVSREEFLAMIERGDMLEHAEYGGNLYGTPRGMVEKERESGHHVILVIEVQGAARVRELCPDAVSVFVMPPSPEVLRERLCGRATESPEALAIRLETAKEEIAHAPEYDYVLVNDDLPRCLGDFKSVLLAASLSPRHNKAAYCMP